MLPSGKESDEQKRPIEIFCSWSKCEEDRVLFEKLMKNLAVLSDVKVRSSDKISLGRDKTLEILKNSAHIILMLLSADYLVSDECRQVTAYAMKQLEACVIPVLLRPFHWRETSFAGRQCLPEDLRPISRCPNKDQAVKEVVKSIDGVVKRLRQQLPSITSLLPFRRNEFFTGYEVTLRQMHDYLQDRPLTIKGPAGIGKTQLALEYAYRYYKRYDTVLWAQAQTMEALITSYITFAKYLQLPQKDLQQQKPIIEAVKDWLRTSSNWLLVLDDVVDPNIIREFLPVQSSGSRSIRRDTYFELNDHLSIQQDALFELNGDLLLTTRATGQLNIVAIDIEALKEDKKKEGVRLLLRRADQIGSGPNALNTVKPADIALASQIVSELEGLPLAISQAGAYIKETSYEISDYWNLYQKRKREPVPLLGGLINAASEPAFVTLSLSLERIKENRIAVELLELCAFVALNAVPEELLEQALRISRILTSEEEKKRGLRLWFSRLRSLFWNAHREIKAEKFGEALETLENYALIVRQPLENYALIVRQPKAETLTIHQLIQETVYNSIPESRKRLLTQSIILAFEVICPECLDFAKWSVLERLLPHMVTCAENIARIELVTHEAAYFLSQVGYYLHENGRDAEVERFYLDALKITQRLWEDEDAPHPDIAAAQNNLAGLYQAQGRRDEAKRLYEESLKIREELLGADHLRTATGLYNLAHLYKDDQQQSSKAEDHYRRALKIRERQLGEEHPKTTATSKALTEWLDKLGR